MANKLYGPGESHARSLIRAGKVNESAGWDMTPADEDKLLGDPPDWTAYASWHLGEDESASEKTKGRYKYPFGKGGEVYRSALRAAASRAGQQGDTEISNAASALITEIDKAKKTEGRTRQWYSIAIRNQAPPPEPDDPNKDPMMPPPGEEPCAEINIFDEIGAGFWSDGVTAKQFVADLAAIPDAVKKLRVRVNSPGGDVFDALAIANALRDQRMAKGRSVEMSIEGLAASAATVVTSAGSPIKIADNALVMVHNPSGVCIGGSADMREVAGVLDRVRGAIIATYRWASQLSADALGALMDARTWMDAATAVKNGFATEVTPGLQVTARFRPDAVGTLGQIPDAYRDRVAALFTPPAPAPPAAPVTAEAKDVIHACREAGFPELAEDLLNLPMADVKARLDEKKAAKAAADKRAADIRALCTTAKFADLAEDYIRGGMTLDAVRSQLTMLGAKRDAGVIDPTPPHDPNPRPRATVPSPTEIYGARRALPAKGA